MISLAGILILMWMFDASLTSEDSFDALKELLQNPLAKFVLWGVLAALGYHLCAGIKHLIMDLGFGETLEGGKLAAKATIAIALVLIVLAGVWVW